MPIYSPKNNKSDFPPREVVPVGNHIARLYSVIHMGVIPTEYKGELGETDTIRLTFELPEETRVFKEGDEAKPMVISTFDLTNSMGEKANLGKLIRGMLGVTWNPNEDTEEMEDITQYLGTACMLNIAHKTGKSGNEYAQIVSAAPIPKSLQDGVKPQVNPNFVFGFGDEWNQEAFEKFPSFIQDKIKSSKDYYRMTHPEEVAHMAGQDSEEGADDQDFSDIPF